MCEKFDATEAVRILTNTEERAFAVLEIFDNAVRLRNREYLGSIVSTHGPAYLEEITGEDISHIEEFIREEGDI